MQKTALGLSHTDKVTTLVQAENMYYLKGQEEELDLLIGHLDLALQMNLLQIKKHLALELIKHQLFLVFMEIPSITKRLGIDFVKNFKILSS